MNFSTTFSFIEMHLYFNYFNHTVNYQKVLNKFDGK